MPNSDTHWVSYHFIGRQLYGGGDITNVDPFLSPGKFYIQSIIPKKTGTKSMKKIKSVFRYSKDIEIDRGYEIQELSKKMPVPNALSMKSANWARPGQPL